eukprot:3274246-Rhodomonas_salina.1
MWHVSSHPQSRCQSRAPSPDRPSAAASDLRPSSSSRATHARAHSPAKDARGRGRGRGEVALRA